MRGHWVSLLAVAGSSTRHLGDLSHCSGESDGTRPPVEETRPKDECEPRGVSEPSRLDLVLLIERELLAEEYVLGDERRSATEKRSKEDDYVRCKAADNAIEERADLRKDENMRFNHGSRLVRREVDRGTVRGTIISVFSMVLRHFCGAQGDHDRQKEDPAHAFERSLSIPVRRASQLSDCRIILPFRVM
jgi:hypothetical protein